MNFKTFLIKCLYSLLIKNILSSLKKLMKSRFFQLVLGNFHFETGRSTRLERSESEVQTLNFRKRYSTIPFAK